ncbi:MAG: TraB/GumN family protein [Thermoplasmatota archaeon]
MVEVPGDETPPAAEEPAEPTEPVEPSYGHLTLIGAGHVFDVEATIRDAILAIRPQRVFVELDRGRLQALIERAQGREVPNEKASFIHKRLEAFQNDVAAQYGAQVGGEMLAAVQAAQLVGAQVGLVDRPANETLRRVMQEITWREKLRGAGLVAASPFKSLWNRIGGKKGTDSVEEEIGRYQDDPTAVLDELGRQFPTVRRVVLDERDILMAKAIRHGMAGIEAGVAVVGDGHVGGLLKRLGDLEPTVYRLADVREHRLPKPPSWDATVDGEGGASLSFGVTLGGPPASPPGKPPATTTPKPEADSEEA